VRDLGSRNGTKVGEVSVIQAFIEPGQVLSLGHTKLKVGLGGATVKVRLSEDARFGSLVGGSVAMRTAFAALEKAAQSTATVLLTGETGTGKEAAAESLHAKGPRAAGPFIVVDCGAIPPSLIESELFGHLKGSFTGATQNRTGAFEAANGGTLFLDEIGELPLELQPRLLRALEQRKIKRIGDAEHRAIDVRVIAATHRDLREEVNASRFRTDLYYRLAVLEVMLPPLRERAEDLPALVEALLAALGASQHPSAELLRADPQRSFIASHPWPGNVRELRNHVERVLALREALLSPAHATQSSTTAPGGFKEARDQAVLEFEARYLKALLAAHDENVSAAARASGLDRRYLYRLLFRHGLR
jgi:DNA-binding NtrC family response regulator